MNLNYFLKDLPERTKKPRQNGLTMAMDKGLSVREVEDFLSVCSEHIDIVKFGWATTYVTPNIKDKIKVYKDAGVPVYFGGTLFEAFIIRNQFDIAEAVVKKEKKCQMDQLSFRMKRSVNTFESFLNR